MINIKTFKKTFKKACQKNYLLLLSKKIIFGFLGLYLFAPIAQLVEQLPFKEKVVGSNPTGRTLPT